VFDLTFYPRKKCWLTIALTFSFFCSIAQQIQIDSLKEVIEKSAGVDKIEPLISLIRIQASIDNGVAFEYAKEAQEIAINFGDSAKIVRTSRIVGQLLNRLSRYQEAEALLERIIPQAKRNPQLLSEYKLILSDLAIANTYQAKYDRALQYNFQVLELREADQEYGPITLLLNNIGVVYFKLRNYDKALEFYTRALDLKRRINHQYDMDRLLINIGLCYNQLNDFQKSVQYIQLGFKECGSTCRSEIRVEGEFGLGVANFKQDKFDQALAHFQESYRVARESNYQRFRAENLVYIGKIYIEKGETELAIKALKESENIADSSKYTELLIDSYRQFSILFNKTGDFPNAAAYQNKYIQLKDSTYNEFLIDNIAKIQTNFAERENIKTIQTKEEELQRQRSLNIAVAIIAVLAALLIFVLYRSNRVSKKVNAALSEAKAIIEDQNRQLLNSNINLDKELKEKNIDLEKANESLRRVNDELDNFIYKTSHDIRGPLASLKGMCNVALMDVKDPIALNYLRKLDITAEKLNTILTRLLIVNQINNSTLSSERIDFDGIINDVLNLEKKKGLPARLTIHKNVDSDIDFYSDKEFVRIILENLIDNAIKFYNDSQRIEPFVDVTVATQGNYLTIRVVDNGIGISQVHPDKIFQMFSRASERSETGGIGLYITKTAVQKLGGTINLKTTPDGFTEFSIQLPLSTASSKVLA
jgi:signal transduction histidine kinase